jgi:para-aminobenzoate synthetase component 1
MTSEDPGAAPFAYFGGLHATDLVDVVDLTARPEALDRGWWAVCATFEGALTGYRFASVRQAALPAAVAPWPGVAGPWRSSLSQGAYERGVAEIRRRIARGDVYQVNLCRLLTAALPSALDRPDGAAHDPLALAHLLAAGNPARYQGVLATGDEWLVTASPELFLRREGDLLRSAPTKGTAGPGEPFAYKDTPENVMICDLVRNDLGRVARTGSVTVEALLAREELPGLAHLVSTVRASLRPGVGWREILAATFPPGSVSGAPKHTALQVISELEPAPRGPYCGAIGYVDGDAEVAELAVGIRTFFTSGGRRRLHFGTGAGITYLSDPAAEWAETVLKAARLIALAGGRGAPVGCGTHPRPAARRRHTPDAGMTPDTGMTPPPAEEDVIPGPLAATTRARHPA